ncbi:Glycosyl phosphatidyl inositol anchor synthesis [Bacidia gigantensis]|uniref:Glycosyl phosphatidyl inositol anchor synthesis n=1 Tax=Bacidia gigantensis TaxID=2732470 RepID=UPI001D03A678|nr:Glycosyl phosphatidyl inositol anchor synthesis [Bacidia gigantensis]KAG8531526.1 Glycosyl phosphatidyl inositol anchor synthesis [Bacidia gigantensis]
MARLGRFGFLGVAIVFHIVYISSIFDIYFVSPIVQGMTSYGVQRKAGTDAPAKRLVLFVGDGLRADKAFQSFPDPSPQKADAPGALQPRPLAPYLRSKVLHSGTFGVSHTRVPTESRPGHVALIAGLYEDVSAVTTGWKLNPVNFDSVFNRSRHTWSWGSPDILLMFKEGALPGRVDADCYGEEFEDFTKDATMLDTWVFDKTKKLFGTAARNTTLDQSLRQDKNVFFLHLLGLDTTGHAYRPYSKEYLHNIKVVDQGVKEITRLIDDFYGDGRTAFVFTADHGMSDWGSHGDGHPDNTRTPLIAWGSGVAKPVINSLGKAEGHQDKFSSDWGFDHIQRNDVSQADVAALMAYLVGLDFPVNSVGELPLAYLSGSLKDKAEAALANALAVLEMYRVKDEQKRATELRYKPFPPLGDEGYSMQHRVQNIRNLISSGKFDSAITSSQELLQIGLDGLSYLQTYDWLFLRALVTLGYLGWIAFAISTVIDMHVLHGRTVILRTNFNTAIFGAIGVVLFSSLLIRRAPPTYYLYAIFPLFFWEEVLSRSQALRLGYMTLLREVKSQKEKFMLGLETLFCVGILEALVVSYFHRTVYTICFLAAQFWPFLYGRDFVRSDKALIVTWCIACQAMSIFTLLDAIKVENTIVILLGGTLMALVGVLYLFFEKSILSSSKGNNRSGHTLDGNSKAVIGIQIGLILLAMFVTRSSVASLQAKRGLPFGNQVVGWIVLASSLTVPFLYGFNSNNHYLHRLVVIFLTFSPIFIILTISYEGLFYFTFCATLVTWVRLEHHVYMFMQSSLSSPPTPILRSKRLSDATSDILKQLKSSTESASDPDSRSPHGAYRPLALSDVRIALFFLFLLQSAFFSTGNIASVSSFSLDSVYRLIPVFNPFSQGILLIIKLMIPFAVISANLGILNRRLGVAPSSLFMVVMAISDVLTMNFFWLVRDEGSWLDIGTSISHFVIASLLCVFVAGLEFVSEVFISGVDVETEDHKAQLNGLAAEGKSHTSNENGGLVANANGNAAR